MKNATLIFAMALAGCGGIGEPTTSTTAAPHTVVFPDPSDCGLVRPAQPLVEVIVDGERYCVPTTNWATGEGEPSCQALEWYLGPALPAYLAATGRVCPGSVE
jgi:hypothetical protein